MKITFVSSRPSLSGGARVIAIYADLLQALGHEVTVVAPSIEQPRLPAKLRALARGHRLRDHPTQSHYDDLRANFRVVDHYGPVTAADVPDADVVIATWWETAYTVALMPPEKGRKFYFVQHHETHDAPNSHLRAGSYFLPLNKITIASWLVDTMRDLYGDAHSALVPNSVD
ncbi:glycosyltransferase family 4 protein, partial [Escherichia coli]|nr:glycosyltransferase family 4 protein [Escherichia coli]